MTSSADPGDADSVRQRLTAAAFDQFNAHGFGSTTVDQIAKAAGVSRRTFFRHFSTKEDVVFPEHDRLLDEVATDLARGDDPPLVAVCRAVEIVLDDYVQHPEASLLRFELTRTVTALRDRETTSVHRYQRLFTRHLTNWLPDKDPLTAELMSACVVAAHNNVLRGWLLGGATSNPFPALSSALGQVQRLFTAAQRSSETVVAVFSGDTPPGQVAEAIRRHTDLA